MTNTEPLLSVRDLKAYFHLDEGIVKAVDGVTFEVRPNEVLGIVGESGCGKSVTMKAILRILEPPGKIESGDILWNRRVSGSNGSTAAEQINLTKLDPHGKEMRAIRGAEIALIPQEPMSAFSPVHTIGDQLIEAIRLHRTSDKREARQLAIDLLRDVGIPMPEQRLDAYSWQLSGGLRQRAIIAMALSCNPRLLIADEPTTAVDVTTQAQVLRLLRELQERRNAAIIFITHDLGVIAQMADYVVVMYLGLVMEQGPVDDIFHAPKHPYTQALLRSIPSMESTPREELPTIRGSIPHPFNKPRGCPFHPRCQQAIPGKCDQRTPALQPVSEQQLASCFLYHDVERSS
ncbi:MAG TPA: ABC transporter ATP-binding protein [Anaerolineae bacterium]|nr:ABC transporter ATP-binding protein [Anaerolineae bacterium]